MIIFPNKDSCDFCLHIREKINRATPCCDAFPEGIPKEYVLCDIKVAELKECANGIKFEADIKAQKECGLLENS